MKYSILAPWKISQQSLLFSYSEEYLQRLNKLIKIQNVFAAAALSSSSLSEFYQKEIKKYLQKKPLCLALDEQGKQFSSVEFANNLANYELRGEKNLIICFGGAYGLPKELKEFARVELISLSKMTMAHELSYVFFLEQLYRAQCILKNHPYHHGEISPLAKSFKS